MSRRKEIFKDAGIYAFSSFIAQALDVVNGVLVRRFLGPASMGIWTYLQVIQNYAKHSSLGVTTATARDVPYLREKGDQNKVDEVKNLVFSFTIFTSILSSIAIAAYAFHYRHSAATKNTPFSNQIFYGLFVVAALLVIQRLYNLYIVLLRAHKEFAFTGMLNIFSSALSIIFTLALTWKFQLYGFYVAILFNYVAMITFIFFKTSYRFQMNWDWKKLWPLLTLGSAVLIADILRTVLTSIDRIVIKKYLGYEALGIYSVALMADNYLYMVPNMLGVIFFPHFQEAFAKRDKPQDLQKYLHEPTVSLSYFFPILIGFVWCSSVWFVPTFLPKYSGGIFALKILSLGSLFFAFTHSFSTFLITVRRHWLLIPINAAAVGFGFAINLIFLRLGWGIAGVAFAEGLISVFYFLLLSIVCLRKIFTLKKIFRLYFKLFLISGYVATVLFSLDKITSDFHGIFLRFIFEFILFLIAMSPILGLGEKETKVIATTYHMAREKFQKMRAPLNG